MKKNRIMMAVLAAALASGCSGGAAPAAVSETEETAAVQEEETLQLMERPSLLDGSFAKNTGTEASAEEYTVEPGLTNVLNYSDVEYLTEGAKKQIEEQIAYYMGNAKIILEGLKEAGYSVSGGVNAPYIWLKTPDNMTSWDFFDYLLEKANVVGTPGSGFGPHGEHFFRLTAFGNRENTIKAVDRIKSL